MARYHPAAELALRATLVAPRHPDRTARAGAMAPSSTPATRSGEMLSRTSSRRCSPPRWPPASTHRQPIPVAPAVHYRMGGIETDTDGATTLAGLYAAGECASTEAPRREPPGVGLAARSGGVRDPRRPRRGAGQGDPGTPSPLPARPAPDLPDAALQSLRRAMSRDAGWCATARACVACWAISPRWKPPTAARSAAHRRPSRGRGRALARRESRGARHPRRATCFDWARRSAAGIHPLARAGVRGDLMLYPSPVMAEAAIRPSMNTAFTLGVHGTATRWIPRAWIAGTYARR